MKSRRRLGMFKFVPFEERSHATTVVASISWMISAICLYVMVAALVTGGYGEIIFWAFTIGFALTTFASTMALINGHPSWLLMGLLNLP